MKDLTKHYVIYGVVIILLLRVTSLLAWSRDPLKAMNSIIIPRTHCPYEDLSTNVVKLSKETITSLKRIQAEGQNCRGVPQGASQVEGSIQRLMDYRRNELGVSSNPSDTSLKVTCKNFPYLFETEFKNAMVNAKRNQAIPSSNFFFDPAMMNSVEGQTGWPDCKSMVTLESDGDFKYDSNYNRCVEDVLAMRILIKKEECALENEVASTDELARKYKKDIQVMETIAKDMNKGLSTIFQNLNDENCQAKDAILRETFKSMIYIGSNIAGSAFGSDIAGRSASVATSIGAEVINHLVDFMARKAEQLSTLYDIEKNENFENAACMFLNVQEEDCKKYNLAYEPAACKEKTPEQIAVESKLRKDTSDIFEYIDNYAKNSDFGEVAGPASVEILQETLKKFDIQRHFPSADLKTLKQILDGATEKFRNSSSLNKFAALANVRAAIHKSHGLIRRYHIINGTLPATNPADIDASITSDARKMEELARIEKQINDNMGIMTDKEYLYHIKDYIRSEVLDHNSINKLMAEELAKQIVDSLDKNKIRTEGDIRRLGNLTSVMVENFKKPFTERLTQRYKESFKDGFRSETDVIQHYNLALTSEDLANNKLKSNLKKAEYLNKKLRLEHLDKEKDRQKIREIYQARKVTFGWLRNTVKDCLATQGVAFMKRKKLTWYNYNIRKNQEAAALNIDRTPKTYLKVCKPFLCNDHERGLVGIPLPDLRSESAAPTDFGKYQCRVIKNYKNIYDQMEAHYVKTGMICGKTISDITEMGRNVHPRWNNISKLKNIIKYGKTSRAPAFSRSRSSDKEEKFDFYDIASGGDMSEMNILYSSN